MSDEKLFDKHGIPIERGDVVKVFHFIGARRKRHYMYKQCLGITRIGPKNSPFMMFSHLNFIENREDRNGPYLEALGGRKLAHHEIVQSIGYDHETRPRAAKGGET